MPKNEPTAEQQDLQGARDAAGVVLSAIATARAFLPARDGLESDHVKGLRSTLAHFEGCILADLARAGG